MFKVTLFPEDGKPYFRELEEARHALAWAARAADAEDVYVLTDKDEVVVAAGRVFDLSGAGSADYDPDYAAELRDAAV